MKLSEQYYHHNSRATIEPFSDSIADIIYTINQCPLHFEPGASPKIKSFFDTVLNTRGWVNDVRMDQSIQTTVNFVKLDVAFVLQLGNVARIYADVLKLSYLQQKNITGLGILAVACNPESKLLGTNYANFNRVVRELRVYSEILIYPILVLGLSN
jgi:hypothetical protein